MPYNRTTAPSSSSISLQPHATVSLTSGATKYTETSVPPSLLLCPPTGDRSSFPLLTHLERTKVLPRRPPLPRAVQKITTLQVITNKAVTKSAPSSMPSQSRSTGWPERRTPASAGLSILYAHSASRGEDPSQFRAAATLYTPHARSSAGLTRKRDRGKEVRGRFLPEGVDR
jgi:hypothetical protein